MTKYSPETVRVVNVRPVNHFKWAIATLLTGGIAGIGWIIAVINRNMTK